MTQINEDRAYWNEQERLWNQTVEAFTAAVRLEHPNQGALDFAEFLTSALRATAANVGDVRTLTAGRPGSWESNILAEMLDSCAGYDRNDLMAYRTEVVVVPLNVSLMVEEEYRAASPAERAEMLLPFDQAQMDAEDEAEDNEAAHDAAREAVETRYEVGFRDYAERFSAAVLAASWDIPRLNGNVIVRVDSRPEQDWSDGTIFNPSEDESESDWLARHLWLAARSRTGSVALPDFPA